jgi:hypothetical protein
VKLSDAGEEQPHGRLSGGSGGVLIGGRGPRPRRSARRSPPWAADRAVKAAELPLRGFTEVLDRMEAIGDLTGLRCAAAGAFRVQTVPVPATNSMSQWPRNQSATLADERSGSKSATLRRSRSTKMVPKR